MYFPFCADSFEVVIQRNAAQHHSCQVA